MSYFIENTHKAIYAAHKKLNGYWCYHERTGWSQVSASESYIDHFNNPIWDYSPITIGDARALYPTIKAFKYIEPQTQEAGTQPAIQ